MIDWRLIDDWLMIIGMALSQFWLCLVAKYFTLGQNYRNHFVWHCTGFRTGFRTTQIKKMSWMVKMGGLCLVEYCNWINQNEPINLWGLTASFSGPYILWIPEGKVVFARSMTAERPWPGNCGGPGWPHLHWDRGPDWPRLHFRRGPDCRAVASGAGPDCRAGACTAVWPCCTSPSPTARRPAERRSSQASSYTCSCALQWCRLQFCGACAVAALHFAAAVLRRPAASEAPPSWLQSAALHSKCALQCCTLHNAHHTLHTLQYTLQAACYTLNTADWMLHFTY